MTVTTPVLIVGAGPTGLVLALWLAKMGIPLRIIDKAGGPGTSSRALALHARTLELYRQLDLSEEVTARGHQVSAATLWVKGKKIRRIVPKPVGEDLTPYPTLRVFPQDEHERLLIDRLTMQGVMVERGVELLDYREENDEVVVRLATPEGNEECRAFYLMGCDGARSSVRRIMGVGFPGGTYDQVFYVADVEAKGPAMDGELHADLDWTDPLGVFPLKERGRARLIGTVKDCEGIEALSFADVAERIKTLEYRRQLFDGIDPIEARRAKKAQAALEAAKGVTFKHCAERYIASHKAAWSNAKHAAQWGSTLSTYTYPVIGKLPVQSVDTGQVLKILESIWSTKAETADRVRVVSK